MGLCHGFHQQNPRVQHESRVIVSVRGEGGTFFQANGIKEDRKVQVFLSSVGSATYGILWNLLVRTYEPERQTFHGHHCCSKGQYEPKPLIITERFHFHRRSQASGESIAEYMAELRQLASKCNFGAYLEKALSDRLICGLKEPYCKRWI